MFGTLGLGLCLGLGLGLGSVLGLLLGLIILGTLSRYYCAQHRPPTSDHNSSRALTVCYKNTCEIRAASAAREATGYDAASIAKRRPKLHLSNDTDDVRW